MKILLGSFFALSAASTVSSQATDLGGGVVTRTDVEYLADLTLDVRDMKQGFAKDGGSKVALEIYVDGKNSEPETGSHYKLTQLSTDISSKGVAKAVPPYLFHLYGLADRSTDLGKLSEHLAYADNFIRSAITSGDDSSPTAVLALSIWMHATHVLYQGLNTCQLLVEADNPSQFNLGSAGFDEFIALWIGTGQTHGSAEGYGLYALAEQADLLFDAGDRDDVGSAGDIAESAVNRKIKALYEEASTKLSLPGVCTNEHPESPRQLWSIVQQIISQMSTPLIQMLIDAILRKDVALTQMYAMAVIPQAAQCRPSTFKRLKDSLMIDNPKFDRTEVILRDLQDIYSCFGLSCDDVGDISVDDFDVDIPDCIAADDEAPMAEYQPTSGVHPVARIDQDVLQLRILTSLGAFQYAKFWYLYGRNSPVQRDSESDPFEFYSLADFAVATHRKNAEPYFSQFVQYHNDPNYADTIIRETLEGKGKWDSSKSIEQRSAVIAETSAFMILYLHLIAQIGAAVNECKSDGDDGEYDLTHPWDEVAALLIGSLEGTEEGGSSDVQDGQLVWSLSTRRGFQFQTLNKKGYAKLNSDFEDFLYAGKGEADGMECTSFETTADKIRSMSIIPLMQSVMKYAIQNEQRSADSDSEDIALGEMYALAIIPILQTWDPAAATIVEENMIFRDGIQPVRDGSQAVADALGASAVAAGLRCSLLGSTPQAKPCRYHSSAYGMRPLVFTSIAAVASLFFIF